MYKESPISPHHSTLIQHSISTLHFKQSNNQLFKASSFYSKNFNMQFTTVVALLVAAVGINAAPAMEKRLDSIPYSIFGGAGCNSSPTPLTTAYIPTDGSCFGISPLVSGDTDSGLIDQTKLKTLPAGCTRKSLLMHPLRVRCTLFTDMVI
jgi:hypothetical protein